MEFIKDSHMSRYKKGRIKDGEQFVFCKLRAPALQNCPEIHIFTDGSRSKPEQILKVKSFAAVRESDLVPKVVKAKYDNYIYIRSEKGVETFLRTDTRQQRDDWCATLQGLMNIGVAARQDAVSRRRLMTDVTSNKPPPMRNRKAGTPATSPGTALGLLHEEMLKKIEPRLRTSDKIDGDVAGCEHLCCDKHHTEGASETEPIYENVHRVRNMDRWKEDSEISKRVLIRNAELYSDYHRVQNMQNEQEELDEDYKDMNAKQPGRIPEENRWSGCSTSSAESTGSVSPVHSAPDGRRQPCESAWPPSPEPVRSESSPEDARVTRYSGTNPEPEAKVEFTMPTESHYMNIGVMRPTPGRMTKYPIRSPIVQSTKSPLHERTISLTGLKSRTLTEEKMRPSVEVSIDKLLLTRQLPTLAQVHDRILVTHIPAELKDYFRVGDQWLKVNDQLLNSVEFAKSCIEMSDKSERVVNITVKRLPYGTLCNFQWTSSNRDDVGLQLNGPEIAEWNARGIAMTHSNLQAIDTTSLTTAGVKCNYIITEVNFEPVHPHSTTETVWREIESAKPDILLILHPQDFLSTARPSSHKLW